MQNIDPVLFIQPALAIAMTVGAIWFWWRRRGFRRVLLFISFVAYAAAIAGKYVIQTLTFPLVLGYFGQVSFGLGLYFGLQTVFLEVGLAYLLAVYGVRRRGLKASDSAPYGLSLAFWENGVLLGLISLLNLGTLYLLLGTGSGQAEAVYNRYLSTQPTLFLPPSTLLPLVLVGSLERVSSTLVHVAWGVLCVIAAVTGRKRFLWYALPMGLVDALVPFASLNSNLFEAGVFLLSVGFVFVAWRATKPEPTPPVSPGPAAPNVGAQVAIQRRMVSQGPSVAISRAHWSLG